MPLLPQQAWASIQSGLCSEAAALSAWPGLEVSPSGTVPRSSSQSGAESHKLRNSFSIKVCAGDRRQDPVSPEVGDEMPHPAPDVVWAQLELPAPRALWAAQGWSSRTDLLQACHAQGRGEFLCAP